MCASNLVRKLYAIFSRSHGKAEMVVIYIPSMREITLLHTFHVCRVYRGCLYEINKWRKKIWRWRRKSFGCQSRDHCCSPWRRARWSRWVFLKDWGQWKRERKEEQQRNHWPQPPFPTVLLMVWGVVWSGQVEDLWVKKQNWRREEQYCFNARLFVSYHPK